MSPQKRRAFCSFSLVLFAVAACKSPEPAKAELQSGDEVQVVDITKGDELIVKQGAKRLTVRLLGLHAFAPTAQLPTVKKIGESSANFARSTFVGKKIKVELDATVKDAHGRYLAYATVEGKDQNLQMIESGHAVVYTEYAFAREAAYLKAESNARATKREMWGNDEAVALVRSLRGLWAETRTKGKGNAPKDELLAE